MAWVIPSIERKTIAELDEIRRLNHKRLRRITCEIGELEEEMISLRQHNDSISDQIRALASDRT